MRKLVVGSLVLPIVLAAAAVVPVHLASASGGCRVTARAPTLSGEPAGHVVSHARETSGCTGRFHHFLFKLRSETRSGDASRLRCAVHTSGKIIRCRSIAACNHSLHYRSVIRAYNGSQLLDSDRSAWTRVC